MLIKGSLCANYIFPIVTKNSRKLAGLSDKMKRGWFWEIYSLMLRETSLVISTDLRSSLFLLSASLISFINLWTNYLG